MIFEKIRAAFTKPTVFPLESLGTATITVLSDPLLACLLQLNPVGGHAK